MTSSGARSGTQFDDPRVALFRRDDVATTLAVRHGVADPSAVARLAGRALPVVAEAIERRLADRDQGSELAAVVAEIDSNALVAPIAAFSTGAHESVGSRLVRLLMGDVRTRRRLAREVVEEGVDAGAVPGLLAAVAWVCAARPAPRQQVVDPLSAPPVDPPPDVPVESVPTADISGATVITRSFDDGPPTPPVEPALEVDGPPRKFDDGPAEIADPPLLLPALTHSRPDPSQPDPSQPDPSRADHSRLEHISDRRAPRELRPPPGDGTPVEAEIRVASSPLVLGLTIVLAALVAVVAVAWLLDRQGYIDLATITAMVGTASPSG